MTNYKALVSFAGEISMTIGEIRDFDSKKEKARLKDLLNAGYIEKMSGDDIGSARDVSRHEAE